MPVITSTRPTGDDMFTGWPCDATAFLAEIEADNTREFWEANGHRHATAVQAPMRALAAELEPEFGPIRVLRAHRNRRFRPESPPYRTDAGGVAGSPGGAALTVVLSATALTTTAGHWAFDPGQLRRYRAAVLEAPGEELPGLLAGHQVDRRRSLRGLPRGFKGEHARTTSSSCSGCRWSRRDRWVSGSPRPSPSNGSGRRGGRRRPWWRGWTRTSARPTRCRPGRARSAGRPVSGYECQIPRIHSRVM
jgi:hypothetical protein